MSDAAKHSFKSGAYRLTMSGRSGTWEKKWFLHYYGFPVSILVVEHARSRFEKLSYKPEIKMGGNQSLFFHK